MWTNLGKTSVYDRIVTGAQVRMAEADHLRSASESPARLHNSQVRLWHLLAVPILSFGLLAIALVIGILAAVTIAAELGYFQWAASAARIFETPEFYSANITMAVYGAIALSLMALILRRWKWQVSGDYLQALPLRQIVNCSATGIGLAILATLILIAVESAGVVFETDEYELALVAVTVPQLIVSLVVVALIFPFGEELYFRGMLLEWQLNRVSVKTAIAMNAVIFAGVHLHFIYSPGLAGWIQTLLIAVVGAICCLSRVYSGSLHASIAIHASYNATLVLLSFAFYRG